MSVDPLLFKYPFYTPYQYAGNKPVSFIDLDGAEEKKGIGLVFGNNNIVEAVNKTKSPNWYSFSLYNLHYAIKDMEDVKETGEKINAVYFQNHVLEFEPGKDNRINTDGVIRNSMGYYVPTSDIPMDDGNINDMQINWFLGLNKKDYEAYDKKLVINGMKYESSYFDTIMEIKQIANMIEDGGYLIIGGCLSAKNEENLKAFYILTGKRINIIGNSTYTREGVKTTNKDKISFDFLDLGRTESKLVKDEFDRGWVIIGPDTESKVMNTGKDLILNSVGGKLFDFIDYNVNK